MSSAIKRSIVTLRYKPVSLKVQHPEVKEGHSVIEDKNLLNPNWHPSIDPLIRQHQQHVPITTESLPLGHCPEGQICGAVGC